MNNQQSNIEVSMSFGSTDIRVVAKNMSNNQETLAQISYSNRNLPDSFQHMSIQNNIRQNVKPYHIILCNDKSGSMGGGDIIPTDRNIARTHCNKLGAVFQCSKYVIDIAEKNNYSNNFLLSCVLFDTDARIIFERRDPSLQLMDLLLQNNYGRDTSFVNGMTQVRNIVNRSPPQYDIMCIFMSDGICSDGGTTKIVSDIRKTHGDKFIVNCVGVGGSDHSVLKSIAQIGNGKFAINFDLNGLIQNL